MPLLVYVDAPASAPVEHLETLVSACTETAPEACVERPVDATDPPDATVQWRGDYDSVRIWVSAGGATQYRTLDFVPEDAVADRIRAAGLLVGAIAREVGRAASAKPSVPSVPEPVEVDLTSVDPPPPFSALGLMGVLGRGLGLRTGLRSELRLGRRGSWIGVYGALSYAADTRAPGDLAVRVLEESAGVRLHVGLRPGITLALAAGLCWQDVAVSAVREDRSASGRIGRAGAEGFVGMTLAVGGASSPLALVVQGRLAAYPANPSILVQNQEVATLSHVEPAGHLGLEVRF